MSGSAPTPPRRSSTCARPGRRCSSACPGCGRRCGPASRPSWPPRRASASAGSPGRRGAPAVRVARHPRGGGAAPLGRRAGHAVLDRLVLAKVRHAIGLDRCGFASSAASPLAVDVAEFFAALGLPLVEVYGMTETTAVATGNRPGRVKIGTVGPALAGIEVRLADDGEVLVRGPINTPGYFRQPGATAQLIDADGWLHTGDVGELDGDGYLRIIDSKKERVVHS